MLERRSFLTGAAALAALAPLASARAAFAAAPTDRRFVLVLLRAGSTACTPCRPTATGTIAVCGPPWRSCPTRPSISTAISGTSGARRSRAALPGGRTAARPGRRHPLPRPLPFRRAEHAGKRQRQTLWRTRRRLNRAILGLNGVRSPSSSIQGCDTFSRRSSGCGPDRGTR